MGTYLNPGNKGFKRILKDYYVDKTGMIEIINSRIDSMTNLICISRPRRFGKSYAARMLCAYYDCTCQSDDLFQNLAVASSGHYKEHLNQYHVIYLDIAGILSKMKTNGIPLKNLANGIKTLINQEIRLSYPDLPQYEDASDAILAVAGVTKQKFIFIIDEWDAVIREAKGDMEIQESYFNLLREWFKNGNFTDEAVAIAYMTGILPIKKDKSQSAISDFGEFTMINPSIFAQYTGFTNEEVKKICADHDMDFDEAKRWYDGYSFAGAQSIYNPYSLMMAMSMGEYESYWKQTSAAENLITYINMKQDDLQSDILKLIAGECLKVNVTNFYNDFQTFHSKDDVLTLLIHLGYLAYDRKEKRVRIPNEEVRCEFDELLGSPQHTMLADLVTASKKLLQDTLSGNETAVAETIERVRQTNYAPMYYNNEQSLRYVIKFAYIVCIDYYLRVEELPAGNGIADVVFIPKRDTLLPAMVVELKWNKSADSAIGQIKDKKYPAVLKGYAGEMVLVGINYMEKTKNHTCRIEKIDIE